MLLKSECKRAVIYVVLIKLDEAGRSRGRSGPRSLGSLLRLGAGLAGMYGHKTVSPSPVSCARQATGIVNKVSYYEERMYYVLKLYAKALFHILCVLQSSLCSRKGEGRIYTNDPLFHILYVT